MKQFPVLQCRILIEKKVEREFINLASHYQQIGESFQETGRRSTTYEEATTSDQFSKKCLFLPMIKIDEKSVIHVRTAL